MVIQDHTATLFNADGIDLHALSEWQNRHKQIAGFHGAKSIDSEAFWTTDMDILIPAALEGQITRERAENCAASWCWKALTVRLTRTRTIF